MGSKKHKKHHKSEKKERVTEATIERPAEPLRLVLKVGGSSASEHGDSPHVQPHPEVYLDDKTFKLPEKHKKSKKKKKKKSSDREKKHKHHHHHEKKEKRKRGKEDSTNDESFTTGDQDESQEPPSKQVCYEDDNVAERPFREPRACTLKNRQGKSPLQHLLEYLLKAMENKDPQQFFAWPVTDHIAPGYSSIIAHPMDFSSMRTKIENNEYSNIAEFRADVKLMCDNAMTYNHPETIYYKSAKRMLHVGTKLTSKEKLLYLRNTLTYINELGCEELGFDTNDEPQLPSTEGAVSDENMPLDNKEIKLSKLIVKPTKVEIGDDGLTPDEILAHARKAAKAAADKLSLRHPNCKFGFLRQQQDGSTSLAILNPLSGNKNVVEERKVTLEMLVGKLQNGTGTITGFKEDKRNIAKPVNYLHYGTYSSYAPIYDSTFSNLTKEESDLVYSTFGDETGKQYAESLLNFSRDCDFASEIADSILNGLTDGEHSKTAKMLENKKKKAEAEMKKTEPLVQPLNAAQIKKKFKKDDSSKAYNPAYDFDFKALKSLSEEGIDVSFLDSVEKQFKKDPIQKKLDETTTLLQDLAKVQNARLTAKPPVHLSQVPGPSNEEIQLAAKVTERLTELSKKATPADLIHMSTIRNAMGITVGSPFDGEEMGDILDSVTKDSITLIPTANIKVEEHMSISSPVSKSKCLERINSIVEDVASGLIPTSELNLDSTISDSNPPSNDVTSQSLVTGEHDETNDEHVRDLEIELREFLETGPTLRVSDSPSQVDVSLDDVIP